MQIVCIRTNGVQNVGRVEDAARALRSIPGNALIEFVAANPQLLCPSHDGTQ